MKPLQKITAMMNTMPASVHVQWVLDAVVVRSPGATGGGPNEIRTTAGPSARALGQISSARWAALVRDDRDFDHIQYPNA